MGGHYLWLNFFNLFTCPAAQSGECSMPEPIGRESPVRLLLLWMTCEWGSVVEVSFRAGRVRLWRTRNVRLLALPLTRNLSIEQKRSGAEESLRNEHRSVWALASETLLFKTLLLNLEAKISSHLMCLSSFKSYDILYMIWSNNVKYVNIESLINQSAILWNNELWK